MAKRKPSFASCALNRTDSDQVRLFGDRNFYSIRIYVCKKQFEDGTFLYHSEIIVIGDDEDANLYYEMLEKIRYILVDEYNIEAKDEESEDEEANSFYYFKDKLDTLDNTNLGELGTEVYFDIGSNANLVDKEFISKWAKNLRWIDVKPHFVKGVGAYTEVKK
ncbi:uncharacterized protein THITE_113024 [Thermothielavioides terrestris NRRL 8126]|uniref:Uncharacterized protein n=1 Tax=Thermothielavioides terrestris (strain ATCC 38088 / NRRL 8126) TaxID=578455 RepID=G2QR84_THETT|nr:uncharacterized protein THITE_113024 [Thermothielavioides terrestris NRRL 8126]AEO63338.1 hypothetical protein THITE_113024 [Thermothielavioides terrestris NRRL 8126]